MRISISRFSLLFLRFVFVSCNRVNHFFHLFIHLKSLLLCMCYLYFFFCIFYIAVFSFHSVCEILQFCMYIIFKNTGYLISSVLLLAFSFRYCLLRKARSTICWSQQMCVSKFCNSRTHKFLLFPTCIFLKMRRVAHLRENGSMMSF